MTVLSATSPRQHTRDDGDYCLSITIGDDVRYVPYRITDGQVHAIRRPGRYWRGLPNGGSGHDLTEVTLRFGMRPVMVSPDP
jgi:hypothetical protein